MNPTSQVSLEEAFAQTVVLAISVSQGVAWADRIPEYNKISVLVFELSQSLLWVLTVNDQAFCQERILEDSPVGLPDQLPNIKV